MSAIQRLPTRRAGSAAGAPVRPAPPARSTGGTSVMTPPSGRVSHDLVGEREQDGLELGVGLDGGPAALAAEAGLAVAAERRVRLQLVAVDAHRAGPDLLGHPHGPLDVAGP